MLVAAAMGAVGFAFFTAEACFYSVNRIASVRAKYLENTMSADGRTFDLNQTDTDIDAEMKAAFAEMSQAKPTPVEVDEKV